MLFIEVSFNVKILGFLPLEILFPVTDIDIEDKRALAAGIEDSIRSETEEQGRIKFMKVNALI